MRIRIKTTSNEKILPFDYQGKLIGVIHKWLGNNELHDKIYLYSFSWLLGGVMVDKKGYVFPNGAELLISFHEDQHLKKIIDSILLDSEIFYGLCVKDITIVGSPVFTEEPQRFFLASPIFIKRRIEEIMGYKYYFYDDQESNQLMTETLKHKMREAGLPEDDTLRVEFDISYSKKKKKMVTIHGIKSIANMCPVIIHGTQTSKRFAWVVGLGNGTGSGYGALI